MFSAGDDDDEFWLRPVWETEEEETPPGSPPPRKPVPDPDYTHPLLGPLARAQHAVTRLDARAEAAAPVIGEGLRARLALREAAGWLAWARFTIHPRDLALRDAGLTGAYRAAALAGRLPAELPATTAQGYTFDLAPSDLAVDQALRMARHWRRLAEMRSWRPLADATAMHELLAFLGSGQPASDVEVAEWLADTSFRHQEPTLIRAGLAARAWMNRAAVKEPLTLDGIFLAACLWRANGFGRAVSLPFWLAPEALLNRLAPRIGHRLDGGLSGVRRCRSDSSAQRSRPSAGHGRQGPCPCCANSTLQTARRLRSGVAGAGDDHGGSCPNPPHFPASSARSTAPIAGCWPHS